MICKKVNYAFIQFVGIVLCSHTIGLSKCLIHHSNKLFAVLLTQMLECSQRGGKDYDIQRGA